MGNSDSEIVEEIRLGSGITHDETNHVLQNVAIFNAAHNKQDRDYHPAAVRKLKAFYEGGVVNVDHAAKGTNASVLARNGLLKNIDERSPGHFYGDWHYNPKHPASEQLVWAALHQPESLGFSHRIRGVSRMVRGREMVEDVVRLISIDVVGNPSSTKSIQESVADEEDMDLATLKKSHPELVAEVAAELREEYQQSQEAKELQEQIDASKAVNDKLQAKLDAIEAEKAVAQRVTEIREYAEEHGLILSDEQVTRYSKQEKELCESHLADLAAITAERPKPKPKPKSSGTGENSRSEGFQKLAKHFRR